MMMCFQLLMTEHKMWMMTVRRAGGKEGEREGEREGGRERERATYYLNYG